MKSHSKGDDDMAGYQKFLHVGLALDPIHVGTGGARLGRVDLTIVRDPVTRVPKIPGSSLAGVYRTYVAMEEHEQNPNRQVNGQPRPYYPHCAGLGQPRGDYLGHCAQPDCPVCTVFGFARGRDQSGGFAGLAAFTDAHVLLFPVPTRQGPRWITCPDALRLIGSEVQGVDQDAVYLDSPQNNRLNLGWLLLPVMTCGQFQNIVQRLQSLGVPPYIRDRLALVPDPLFAHIVNSNLEVRTSVAINPATGAAEEQALFSYEALPRGTVLAWEIIAKNPKHFRIEGKEISAKVNGDKIDDPEKVFKVTQKAHEYLEHLGVGGMGTRGMGRLRVLFANQSQPTPPVNCSASSTSATGSSLSAPAPSTGDTAASSSGTTEQGGEQ
jgi:CRISPR-associated protein Cmr4